MFLLVLVLILFIVIYLYATRNHDYWKKRNVKHDKPIPIFGNHFRNVFCIKSLPKISVELYNKYPGEEVIGYLRGTTPELIIRDPELVRVILSVDFLYFHQRGLGRDPNVEPLLANLFHAEDDSWKLLRKQLTPAFTTAKLKGMFPLVVRCAEKLQDVGEGIVARGDECDMRELMACFTTEFIGACGFGIEMDTINNERSLFRSLGKKAFDRSLRVVVLFGLSELFPELRKVLHITNCDVEPDITNIIKNICEQRNNKPSNRNDFIDLLLELRAKGKIKGESMEKRNSDGTPIQIDMEMDIKCMVAQAFVFFVAGFETSSSATSFTLHELAYNPDVQRRIQEEIDEVLMKYDSKICYDAIAEMSLLNMAFKEAMRIFPPLGILNRVCTKRYTIPNLNITIDPGVKIIIPIQAIQTDEKHFENPLEFRPDRFTESDVRKKYTYLPFGEGPRACIGARLGEMQSMAGLVAILHRFTVEPAPTSRRHLHLDHRFNVLQRIKGGLPLKLKFRKSNIV